MSTVLVKRILSFARYILQKKSDHFLRVDSKQAVSSRRFFRLNEIMIECRNSEADIAVIIQTYIRAQYKPHAPTHFKLLKEELNNILSLKSRPLIIDLGANIGISACWLSSEFEGSFLIAVEPEATNYELCVKNICNNSIDATCIRAALGNNSGLTNLIDNGNGEWGFRTITDGGSGNIIDKVQTITLDEILDNYHNYTPFILKVDIEGAERFVFSNRRACDMFALIIVELHDWLYPWKQTSTSCIEYASLGGHDIIIHNENIFLFNKRLANPIIAQYPRI